ncbi:TLC domain-containing protein [Plectosphaerella cucumerina]|uniref:TLC domain-containing protein n=1 Tax=Plectosphaerella cucumerina TaxID=40658 RepID=A0A8K0TBW4_9PEZI|nr:TLC domain-containing protein [Plectosphaerella cucumerina]
MAGPSQESEPFPPFSTSAQQFEAEQRAAAAAAVASAGSDARRRPRKSSALGEDIHVGDTRAPALATSRLSLSAADHPNSSPSPSPTTAVAAAPKRISKRRRARGLVRRFRNLIIKRTYVLPSIILALFGLAYAINPTPSNPVYYFIILAYRLEPGSGEFLAEPAGGPVTYGKGPLDFAFVSFYTVVLSFTREFIMQEMLRPLARRAGITSRAKQARFMEQMYTAVYFFFLGPAGLYVMSSTPVWYYNTAGMYEGFPHRTHEAGFKFYYLFQAAYWAQQGIVLVLGMEKPRKDFKELIMHHICTLALIYLSYRFHFTYIGIAVYNTHDISDFFLATSKSLNYVGWAWVDYYFVFFIGVWVYCRHFLNLAIIWSVLTEFKTVGPFELDWVTQQYKCWISQYITFALLASLQALNLVWLYYIVRIAYRFVAGKTLEDDRSEVEDNDEEDDVAAADKAPPAVKRKDANGHAMNGNGHAVKATGVSR